MRQYPPVQLPPPRPRQNNHGGTHHATAGPALLPRFHKAGTEQGGKGGRRQEGKVPGQEDTLPAGGVRYLVQCQSCPGFLFPPSLVQPRGRG